LRERILVVDADPTARNLLKRLLNDKGWAAESAPDAPAALSVCRRSAFALVVVDLRLPGMGGSELATIMGERWPDMGVIVTSGAGDVGQAVSCMRAGAHDYLTKPLDLDNVVLRIERALERRRLILDSKRQQRQLEAKVRQETRATRRLFLGAIKSLCSALEAKDDYTRGHSERVSRLSGEIAREIVASAADIRRLRLAGRLHDIGKIGVREGVLTKPGPLTEQEYRHIQEHSVIGERILAPALVDTETLQMVRHHHERYGGGGYPDGLRGSAIPLGARVLAVADAFDALTSDRPYRSRLSPPEALEVLRQGAGSQWQPTLVEALVQRLKAGLSISGGATGR